MALLPDTVARIPGLYGQLGASPGAFLPERPTPRFAPGAQLVHWLGIPGLLLVSSLLAYLYAAAGAP